MYVNFLFHRCEKYSYLCTRFGGGQPRVISVSCVTHRRVIAVCVSERPAVGVRDLEGRPCGRSKVARNRVLTQKPTIMKGNIIAYHGKNKLGNYIHYIRGGVQMARAYPEFVSNPKTERQLGVRAKFAAVSRLARPLSPVLAIGFAHLVDANHSGRNIFFKRNYGAVTINASTGAVTINYDELEISSGNLIGVNFGSPDFATAGKVVVPITDGNTGVIGARPTDKVMLAAYNPTFGRIAMSTELFTRDQNEVQVTLPHAWSGTEVELYAFVTRDGGTADDTSTSMWLGSGTVA